MGPDVERQALKLGKDGLRAPPVRDWETHPSLGVFE